MGHQVRVTRFTPFETMEPLLRSICDSIDLLARSRPWSDTRQERIVLRHTRFLGSLRRREQGQTFQFNCTKRPSHPRRVILTDIVKEILRVARQLLIVWQIDGCASTMRLLRFMLRQGPLDELQNAFFMVVMQTYLMYLAES